MIDYGRGLPDKELQSNSRFEGMDASRLRELIESFDKFPWKFVMKWVEDHGIASAVAASNLGKVKNGNGDLVFPSLEYRGLNQAQTEAYLGGLRFLRGIELAVKREFDLRVRAVRNEAEPVTPTRRSGVRTPGEYTRYFNELFGEGPAQ